MIPRATMRLQLHKDFTFNDAGGLIPYLLNLGISHVYSSPILTATAGSIHGYDVIDPTAVNPELGGEAGLRDFVAKLRAAGLGLIVDIVPNHMAVGGADNPWWTDLLRHGRSSRFADFFDVDWESQDPDLRGKVLAPFLGQSYGKALAAGEIRLVKNPANEPMVRYFDNDFPINPSDYAHICESGVESFDSENRDGRCNLHKLLERQHYRLAWWGAAGDEINWRRFFDINGLAGLRIELPKVFEETHRKLFQLYADGMIDGFRVDHVDGLSDPPGYCRRLRQRLHELRPETPAYLVIEKILGSGEALPTDWGVDGTSGYDFMDDVSLLQHDLSSAAQLGQLWSELTHRPMDFMDEEIHAREQILQRAFDAQLGGVTRALHRVARSGLTTRDVSASAIRRGLVALLSHFPVYRGYDAGAVRSAMDQAAFAKALTAAKASQPASEHAALDHLDRWLGGQPGDPVAATRFQQLSAPVAAKAVEDTAFYRYGRLLSRNDVGFDAARLGGSVSDFHHAVATRGSTFPGAMLATATHDHKRGEDVRARLAVISEIPGEWDIFLRRCLTLGGNGVDPADQIMLYQMIVGAWPLDLTTSDPEGCRDFAERLASWQQKALREAKLRTDWVMPNSGYEARARDFLFNLVAPDSPFLALAQPFIQRIAPTGALNGIVQMILKMTVPGVPDFFQGSDFWDFSLVDPDNRRPVDYSRRESSLAASASLSECLGSWRDGRIKQCVMKRVLDLRASDSALFAVGDYRPLTVSGPMDQRMICFVRSFQSSAVVVIVPRLVQPLLVRGDALAIDPTTIPDEKLTLPPDLEGRRFRSLLTDGSETVATGALTLRSLLSDFPAAILHLVESA